MKRLDSIQMLRGVAALAVVVFHICTLSKDYANGVFFQPFTLIGNAGVDLFFVISGFVMAATTYDTFDTPGAPARFAIHRFSRIYPPYWILSVFVFAYYLYDPAGVNAEHGGVDLAASFWLTPGPLLPLIPVAWTLVHEVMFYAVFFVAMCILPHRQLGRALVVWASLIGLNMLTAFASPASALTTYLLHPFNLEFIGGTLIGLHYRRAGVLPRGLSAGITTVAIALFLMIAVYLQSAGAAAMASVPARISLFAIPSLLLVVGCLGLRFASHQSMGPLTRMGDYSYSLYLVHILIIHFAYRLITKKLEIVLGFWSAGALAIGLLFTSLGVGWLFYRFVETPSCAAVLSKLTDLREQKYLASK